MGRLRTGGGFCLAGIKASPPLLDERQSVILPISVDLKLVWWETVIR